ncbi:MAG: hypothetical protein ABIP17_08825, partial [Ilumatobacteraceae bacterium]
MQDDMEVHAQIGLAMLAPGWQTARRRPVLGLFLLVIGVAAPVLSIVFAVATGRNAVAMGLDADVLGFVFAVGLAALLARVAALVELWFAIGRRTSFAPVETVALVAALAAMVAGSIALAEVQRARATVRPVFVESADVVFDADEPLATPPTTPAPTVPPTQAAPTTTTAPTAATFPEPVVRIVTTTTSTTTTLPPRPSRPESGIDPELLR